MIVAGVIARIVIGTTGFQVDDALITYRYADNIAAGAGFTYNPGEYVCGTTTPLLTVLLALTRLIGVAPDHAAFAIAILSSAAASLLAARLMGPGASPLVRIAAACGPAFLPAALLWSVSGMETMLFAAALLGIATAFVEKRSVALGVALAIAFLTRFDGVVAAPALVLASMLAVYRAPDRRAALRAECALLLRAAAVGFTLVSPWILFAWLYFGNPVPQSVWAKLALYGDANFDRSDPLAIVADGLRITGLAGPELPSPIALIDTMLCAVAVAVVLWRGDRRAVIAALVVGYVAFYATSRSHIHPWYLAPPRVLLWPVLIVLAGEIAARYEIQRRGISYACAAICVGALIATNASWQAANAYAATYACAHAAIGRELAAASRPGETVYAWDIGYVGYLSHRRILDFVGIVSPEVMPFNRNRRFADVIERYQPEWLVVGLYLDANDMIITSPVVANRYRLVQRFGNPAFADWSLGDPRRRDRYIPEYAVFRRIDLLPVAPTSLTQATAPATHRFESLPPVHPSARD